MVSRQILSPLNLQFRGGDRLILTTKNFARISCCSSHSHVSVDPYNILGIRPWATVPQVKKAFRKLAKQYHPDVCKGKNCGVQFEEINAAYEAVMSDLRGESSAYGRYGYNEDNNNEEAMGTKNDPFSGCHEAYDNNNDHMKGRTDQHWDYRDEWIGWEVGNWMFYHQQESQDMTSSEETDKQINSKLNNKSCYSQLMDTSSYNKEENVSS